MDFKDWYNKELANDKRSAVYIAGAKRGFEAGQQSKQAEIDALKKKYDAMYNAFVVANDCRKEWHGCFTRAKEENDRLQSMINQAVIYMDNGCSGSLSPMLKTRRILKGEQQ